MKKIIIPTSFGYPTMDIVINYKRYTLLTGVEIEVDDSIAEVIENAIAFDPKEGSPIDTSQFATMGDVINQTYFRGWFATIQDIMAAQGTPSDFAYCVEDHHIYHYIGGEGWRDSGVEVPISTGGGVDMSAYLKAPTVSPTTMSTHVLAYNPIMQTTSWQLIAGAYGGTVGSIVTYSATSGDMSMMATNATTIYVATPKGAKQAANKDYVDNLPDHRTFTAEEKAKWRGMIGATKLYHHMAYVELASMDGGTEVFFTFISPIADTKEAFRSSQTIITNSSVETDYGRYLILGLSDDRAEIYLMDTNDQHSIECHDITNVTQVVSVEEL